MRNALWGASLAIGLAVGSSAAAQPAQSTYSFYGGQFANAQVESATDDGLVQIGLYGFEMMSIVDGTRQVSRDVSVSYVETAPDGTMSMGWGFADMAPRINMNGATLFFSVNVVDELDGMSRVVSGTVVLDAVGKPYWDTRDFSLSCGEDVVDVSHALALARDVVVKEANVDGAPLEVTACYECKLGTATQVSLSIAKP